jgi:DNA-binding transcriptional regulator GbsR (MarR family)
VKLVENADMPADRDHEAANRNQEAVHRFVEAFASTLVDSGVPQMPALVFVALLTSDDGGLTADELAAQLQVSRAAISGAVNYLAHVNLVTRERQPGSRRHRYVLQDPTWYEMVARRERLLDRWIATTREGITALGARSPAGQRLAESLEFFEFLSVEMPAMLARWRERQARADRATRRPGRGRTRGS